MSGVKKKKFIETFKNSYSQFGQDLDILVYLNHKKGGYFIEMGASVVLIHLTLIY